VRQPHGGSASVLQDSLAVEGGLSVATLTWKKQVCVDGASDGTSARLWGAEVLA
jgi:hypothetical protein